MIPFILHSTVLLSHFGNTSITCMLIPFHFQPFPLFKSQLKNFKNFLSQKIGHLLRLLTRKRSFITVNIQFNSFLKNRESSLSLCINCVRDDQGEVVQVNVVATQLENRSDYAKELVIGPVGNVRLFPSLSKRRNVVRRSSSS